MLLTTQISFFQVNVFCLFFLFLFSLFSVLCSSVSSSHPPFCNFQKLFCSLDCSPFLGTWIANVLSSLRLSSCHIYGDFWWTEVLNFSIVKHPSFLLQSLLFVTCLKKSFCTPRKYYLLKSHFFAVTCRCLGLNTQNWFLYKHR